MAAIEREVDREIVDLLELGRANVQWLAEHVDCTQRYVKQRLSYLAAAGEVVNLGAGVYARNALQDREFRGDAVSQAEVDHWVTLVFALAGTEASDIGGGVAPRTIHDRIRSETDRSARTIKRHLRQDDRVEEVDGVAIEISQCRSSFVPA